MTPEERAKAIVDTIRGRQETREWEASIIGQAITQAENDKLEEAAREFERRDAAGGQIGVPDDLLMSEAGRAAKIVRSLKTPKQPDPPPETPDQRVARIRRTPNRFFSPL